MTNTYKLKSGKTISEDQTITAEELTVAEYSELRHVIKAVYSYSVEESARDFRSTYYLTPANFPITILNLPTPEPKAPLTVDGIIEGWKNGKTYEFTKEGFKTVRTYGDLNLYTESAIDWMYVPKELDPPGSRTPEEIVENAYYDSICDECGHTSMSKPLSDGDVITGTKTYNLPPNFVLPEFELPAMSFEQIGQLFKWREKYYASGPEGLAKESPIRPELIPAVPWLPIEQIVEVFPDWETSERPTLLKDEETMWYYSASYDDGQWYTYGPKNRQVRNPTHFAAVILGDA